MCERKIIENSRDSKTLGLQQKGKNVFSYVKTTQQAGSTENPRAWWRAWLTDTKYEWEISLADQKSVKDAFSCCLCLTLCWRLLIGQWGQKRGWKASRLESKGLNSFCRYHDGVRNSLVTKIPNNKSHSEQTQKDIELSWRPWDKQKNQLPFFILTIDTPEKKRN